MPLKKNPICGAKLTINSVNKEARGRGRSPLYGLISERSRVAWSYYFGGSLQSHVNIEVFNAE